MADVKLTPTNLINWAELSRLLCGNRSSLTPKRISKKHRENINYLLHLVDLWLKENKPANLE